MTSIAEERVALARVGLTLRTRGQWGATFNYTTSRPVNEPATQAFCHISVTNPDQFSSNDAHMRAIERIGINRFPLTGISYNGAVLPGGHLYEGQPWGRRGAHTVNTRRRSTCSQSGCPSIGASLAAPSWNNNVTGRALVFARNVDDPITDADVQAAARYWAGYKLAGLLTKGARLHGHRCCATKDCPGGRVWARMDDIADLTATYVRTGLPGTQSPEDDLPTPAEVWNHEIAFGLQADTMLSNAREWARQADANTEGLSARLTTVEGKLDQVLALLTPEPPTP